MSPARSGVSTRRRRSRRTVRPTSFPLSPRRRSARSGGRLGRPRRRAFGSFTVIEDRVSIQRAATPAEEVDDLIPGDIDAEVSAASDEADVARYA
jgi:hypothetical protein